MKTQNSMQADKIKCTYFDFNGNQLNYRKLLIYKGL